MASKFLKIFVIVGILFLISFLLAKNFNSIDFSDKIVFISIKGTIVSSSSNGIFNEQQATSTGVISYLNKAKNDNTIKAVILEINSPGGEALASREIVEAVKGMNKPVVAWIRDVGASGAYWVASASNKIVASPMSITGSIGVISSYLEFSKLFEKYGITYQRLTSGELKDVGSPYRELSDTERMYLQKKLDIIHEHFIDVVAENRNMSKEKARKLADGSFYLGTEAKELGLVDYLGDREFAIDLAKKMVNNTEVKVITYKKKETFWQQITKLSSYYIGIGIGETLMNFNLEKEIRIKA